jgi:hypothetical protein
LILLARMLTHQVLGEKEVRYLVLIFMDIKITWLLFTENKGHVLIIQSRYSAEAILLYSSFDVLVLYPLLRDFIGEADRLLPSD